MSKARSAALQKEINRLAGEIRLEHAKLEDARKKDLLFIYKHLRKAAKAIRKSAKKAKPSPQRRKKSAAPRAVKQRPPSAQQVKL